MYFNKKKYESCIGNLVAIQTAIILFCLIVFAGVGGAVGYYIMKKIEEQTYIIFISAFVGAIIGFIIGLCSTWRVEMQIQEAYWRIDVIDELKNQTSAASKNAPIAKTVVAIENRQIPSEAKIEEKQN